LLVVEVPGGGVGDQVQGEAGIGISYGLEMDLREAFGQQLVVGYYFLVGSGLFAIGFLVAGSQILGCCKQGEQHCQEEAKISHFHKS
jgi:hypothetical protein